MSFERARAKDQIDQRKDVILSAANELYNKGSYPNVTFAKLSQKISLSRPAIYKYFKKPEEILMELLRREIIVFEQSLNAKNSSTPEDFTNELTKYLLHHDSLLKLFSITYTVIEPALDLNHLILLKQEIFSLMLILKGKLQLINSNITEEKINTFQYSVLTFVAAVYPISHGKQEQYVAMEMISQDFIKPNYPSLIEQNIKSFVSTALT
ncbi:TetR/AcrR family transcriptional regulator [Lactiplantibacillus paraplantarum]|uniref:TetR/AcrR family transcriptional regulator n=1 Tax=Lactiplantibacillus paraplantarum TaxID=60520 RepID=UPI0023AAD309|nr:TetR/AcrR family transcriptional regulator [Lactiplantibacillus paraplantarum]WEE35625.1 TetR/AcrR family transcriptional regulator [Lactiplantibacillus paraplantarum]